MQQINLSKSAILHTDRGTEFVNEKVKLLLDKYANIEELKNDVDIFVHNYNNFRLHSKLGYKSPVEYRFSS